MGRVNLFFIGEPKCGTTVMYEYFKGHRDCFVPEVKEPRHFCDDFFENTWFSDAFCEYKSLWKYENLYDFSQKKNISAILLRSTYIPPKPPQTYTVITMMRKLSPYSGNPLRF